jgi:LCP family protein required for cell wall assembly
VLAAPVGALIWSMRAYSSIPKVDVSSVLSSRSGRTGTNYLIVGTDSREGISANDPNANAFLAEGVSGSRTDTIMVLHVDGGSTSLTSIPRDLWVTDPVTGQKGRINSTFSSGPKNLITAVEALGIPVDHYLQIGFVSFAGLVDAVGGISVTFDHPARDEHSGLYVYATGPVHLDGVGALAYVRSRYYSEYVDGRWRVDGTADLGRTERQRAFMTALLSKVTTIRNPFTLASIPSAIGKGMVIDSTLSFVDALRLAWTLKDLHPEAVAIPVVGRRTTGGADVLELAPDSSAAISPLGR